MTERNQTACPPNHPHYQFKLLIEAIKYGKLKFYDRNQSARFSG